MQIGAPSALLMEASTGTVLFEQDADTKRPPASVTKIMTMLLIFDAVESKKFLLKIKFPYRNLQRLWAALRCFRDRGNSDGRYNAKVHFNRKCKRCLCGNGRVYKRQ